MVDDRGARLPHADTVRLPPERPNRQRAWFVLATMVAAVLHWIPRYPPMIDLAQHGGQVRFLHELGAAAFRYQDIIELNLFTPYLPAYMTGAGLLHFMSALSAMKLLWTVSVLATVYCAIRVRRLLGGSGDFDWLILPGLFGLTFQYGFLTFQFALPLGFACLELWIRFSRQPTIRGGALCAVALAGLFFAHALVTAWVLTTCGVASLAFAQDAKPGLRRWLATAAPLVAPLPVAALWLRATQDIAQTKQSGEWFSPERYATAATQWLGISDRPTAWLVAIVLVALPFLCGARLSRSTTRTAPLLVTVMVLVSLPVLLYGNSLTYNRFFSLLGPSLVWALQDVRPRRAARSMRAWLPLLTGTLLVVNAVQLRAFAVEQQDFQRILAKMPPGRTTLGIVVDPRSESFGTRRTYLHFPVWYQAETGGLVEPSFAAYLPMIAHFRSDYQVAVPYLFELNPSLDSVRFSPAIEQVLVRSKAAPPPIAERGFRLAAHEGTWWFFER